MILKIPFYPDAGDGKQCAQVCMQMVLKHFLDKEFSVGELVQLTNRAEGLWTWPPQIVVALHDLGLKVTNYTDTTKAKFEEFVNNGEAYIRRHFKDADKILSYADVSAIAWAEKRMLELGLFETKKLALDDLKANLAQGHISIVLMDWNKIIGKEDTQYQGHLVVVTGFDDSSIYFHHTGPINPKQNMRVPAEVFERAWSAPGAENDAIVVFGKRLTVSHKHTFI
ncbi:hypothetical protein HYS54_02235 [Candidatus Micrarchaeota archaeon]|nr:hypothetical protein [Candidatus Micrarchaeota archaeon]